MNGLIQRYVSSLRQAVIHLAVFLVLASESLSQTNENPGAGFAQVLIDAKVDLEALSLTWNSNHKLTMQQREATKQILYWLDRFDQQNRDRFLIPTEALPADGFVGLTGELVSLRGRVLAVKNEEVDSSEASAAFHFLQLEVEGLAENVTVLSKQVPSHWSEGPLVEPVSLQGVVLRSHEGATQRNSVVLTERVAWFPEAEAPAGWLELARLGYDASLLDEVRHGQPFVDGRVSDEGEAFRSLLAVVSQSNQERVFALAQNEVAARERQWRQQSRTYHAQWKEADPKEDREIVKKLKRQRDIALAVVDRADKGLSSVAPLFLQPEQEVGRLVLLEGTARRALRVAAQDETVEQPYYELEFFTTDSQNLPIVCCVPSLPPSFPTGDQIREPIRVAGFFFKKWRYQSRKPRKNGDEGSSAQKTAFAPLVIAPAITWVQPPVVSDGNDWSIAAGAVVLLLIFALGFFSYRLGTQDRIARHRPRRYDERS